LHNWSLEPAPDDNRRIIPSFTLNEIKAEKTSKRYTYASGNRLASALLAVSGF
jgi:hypothetical protein